ncbi:hypothetical protein M404DRAFT_124008 [Pisolithus tinctorius Marx 270]|uniref:Transcription factor IIIC subunit Tfc1/Sfc1 triple barrel domain-containing protein n=1 Tax=Pisolithus tinctorius Marx 270 TaxID=870435 RepID=A0A0C3PU73_PISTI|nr:hypothetical protein M404DRAFT_124008 [Pisolithus tinctorius Marx 270]
MVTNTQTATVAQEQPLPATQFFSVEYPGYVQPSSVHIALRNLGGPSSLENAFKRGAAKNEGLLELNFRPGNPFAHPIPGDIVNTSNILFKVTKRKRRKVDSDKSPDAFDGDYTVEAMGVILKTARFRSMADYQFQPVMSDPVAQLRIAMDRMNVDAIRRYTIPDEKEAYSLSPGGSIHPGLYPQLTEEIDQTLSRSNLRLFPPSLFSRQGIPQNYNYQRVYFRNANHPMSRTSVVTRRQEGRSVAAYISRSMEQEETAGIEQRKSHIFDGQTITKETAAFQLCDIIDPMLKEMIEREEDLRETCDERDGWYSAHALERIKTVLRHKFFSLLQGYVATNEECEALLEQGGGQKKTQITRSGKRLKYGRHNMAKGALRPEDAAAARLQATLERNAKNLQSTRRVGKHVCYIPLPDPGC